MLKLPVAALALTLVVSAHAQTPVEEAKLIEAIKAVDQAELAAVLANDVGALEKYWAEDFTVNAPNNQVLKGRKDALELVRLGILDYASFERQVEAVLPHGDTVIVMGLETVKPRGKAPFAGQTLRRRCTNIWMKRNGQWQLTARHASIIPEKSEPAGITAGLSPADEAAVRGLVSDFADTWNRHDMQAMHDLDTEDVHWINVSGNHWRGKATVYKGHDAIHRILVAKTPMAVEKVEVRSIAPDVAVAVATMKFAPAMMPGVTIPETRTRGSFVGVKRDGVWKIVHFQNTIINEEHEKTDPVTWENGLPPGRKEEGDKPEQEKPVRETVQRFYDTFNSHDWGQLAEFATEDFTHINPGGGWTRGREEVLKLLKQAHSTFLKDVQDIPDKDKIEVRFATADVAVVTVPSTMKGIFTTPDGKKHENDRNNRTFVVVKRGGKWLIMQDQNTIRGG